MLTVQSDEASLADARDLVRAFLTTHCAAVDSDAVRVVVSELVTNAMRHTDGPWSVTADLGSGVLTVDVTDTSTEPLRCRPVAWDGDGGGGLHLVHGLAGQVRVTTTAVGKTVTAMWPLVPRQQRP
ncbi:ATP-binding protein [Streptomyces sp. NPDC058475]|uniref:ATP-binding protein n=1 Tax=Streptomyces sp. NPDC058475 TaxID=3346518 RepID=UPI0036641237